MIKLSNVGGEFQVVPEGIHVFLIEDVEYDKEWGSIKLKMKTKNGLYHTEQFNLIGNDGQVNQGALNAFTYMVKTAMQDWSIQEIDHKTLIGKYIKCEVKHNVVPSKKDPNKTLTFVNLGNKYKADGFEGVETGQAPMGLDDLLSDGDELPF